MSSLSLSFHVSCYSLLCCPIKLKCCKNIFNPSDTWFSVMPSSRMQTRMGPPFRYRRWRSGELAPRLHSPSSLLSTLTCLSPKSKGESHHRLRASCIWREAWLPFWLRMPDGFSTASHSHPTTYTSRAPPWQTEHSSHQQCGFTECFLIGEVGGEGLPHQGRDGGTPRHLAPSCISPSHWLQWLEE